MNGLEMRGRHVILLGCGLVFAGIVLGAPGSEIFKSSFEVEDFVAPVGGQVTSVALDGCGAVTVNFSNATDNETSADQLAYDICYSATSDACLSSFTANATVQGSPLQKSFNGLLASNTYYFVVRARDLAGNINQNVTQIERSMNDGTSPGPTSLSLTPNCGSPGSGSITLSRSSALDSCPGPSGITYEYCQSSISTGCDTFSVSFESELASVDAMGLTANTNYYFRVRARDSWGNPGSASPVMSTKTHLSFSQSILPVFAVAPGAPGGCAGCHAYTHANIVNAASSCSGRTIISPGSTDLSSMYQRVNTAVCGSTMPPTPYSVSSTWKAFLAIWINEGACNN